MSNTVHISNLPLDSTIYQINTEFCKIGDVKRSYLVKDEKKQPVGDAVVSFKDAADVISAVERLHNTDFKGKTITVTAAEPHVAKAVQPSANKSPKKSKKKAKSDGAVADASKEEESAVTGVKRTLPASSDTSEAKTKKPKVIDEVVTAEIQKKLALQASRVLVKNIPHQVNEDTVNNFYSRFGPITEVTFPLANKYKKSKKSAFLQFTNKVDAQNAISEGAETLFMEHKVTLQLAVPKDKFQASTADKVKKEEETDEKPQSKLLPLVDFSVIVRNLPFIASKKDVKDHFGTQCSVSKVLFPSAKGCCFVHFNEEKYVEEAIEKFNLTEFMERTITVQKALSKASFSSSEPLEGGEVKNVRVKQERIDPGKFEHHKVSKDVTEQRTLFISGLTLDTTHHSLESMLSQWGGIKYVKLVQNKLTETNSGTAFAQFISKEAADACLEAAEDPARESDFMINHKLPKVMRAVARGEVPKKEASTGKKDKRNLVLLGEGFVKGGNRSAEGVSLSDIKMRKLRVEAREKLLKNLHNRVSQTRLQINNLPHDLTKNKLLNIFKEHAPKGAAITEARVMFYLDRVAPGGGPLSRGYGFVDFRKHEHALAALHAVNNNPAVFTVYKRPIVEFAIESINVKNIHDKRAARNKLQKKAAKGAAAPTDAAAVAAVRRDHDSREFAGYMAKAGDARGGRISTQHKDRKKRKTSKKGKNNSRSRVHPKNKKN